MAKIQAVPVVLVIMETARLRARSSPSPRGRESCCPGRIRRYAGVAVGSNVTGARIGLKSRSHCICGGRRRFPISARGVVIVVETIPDRLARSYDASQTGIHIGSASHLGRKLFVPPFVIWSDVYDFWLARERAPENTVAVDGHALVRLGRQPKTGLRP